MIIKHDIERIAENKNLNYEIMASIIGHNNTKKVSAILEILKIDLQSVADTKAILKICELLIENETTAFLNSD